MNDVFARLQRPYRSMSKKIMLLGMLVLTVTLGFVPSNAPVTLATTAPSGFQDTVVLSGLSRPTAVRFAPDGRIFVAQKGGRIIVYDDFSDTQPTILADLRTNVYNFWDRGLLSMELHPDFPTNPYLYILYTYDALIGGTAPLWGQPDTTYDNCPDPPGNTTNGCVVSGRLSRLQVAGDVMTGTEQVLIEGWCQQYPSHSIGSIAFGPDGALYASSGDGASGHFVDYGQNGIPLNPCGDPPVASGVLQTAPTSEGGALRSQSPRRPNGQPVVLNGTVIRVDPNTGEGLPGNPFYSSTDANERRIISYGLRNPFRMTVRPNTNELWLGDVGWSEWEEINRISNPTTVTNFGWPCYEGNGVQPGYDNFNFDSCETLYGQANAVIQPMYTYRHSERITNNGPCPRWSSATTGLAFYTDGDYPAKYEDALFLADYSRKCIWAMLKDGNGDPDPNNIEPFIVNAATPVDLQIGPGGDLFYVDHIGGTIHRVRYYAGNQPPTADIQATPTNGPAPLQVQFSAAGSSDPDTNDTITYAWDLDGDSDYNDSHAVAPTYTYASGNHTVSLRVTDSYGVTDTATQLISSNNTPPSVSIDAPLVGTLWEVDDLITFSGHATDQQDGNLPASALTWSILLHHCYAPDNCHVHVIQELDGVSGGTFNAPNHEYPSYLELVLTARDSAGLESTTQIQLHPRITTYTFETEPAGLELIYGEGHTGITNFTEEMVVNAEQNVIAPLVQQHLSFDRWQDGSTESARTIRVESTPQTLRALYENKPPVAIAAATVMDDDVGQTVAFSSTLSTDPEGDAMDYRWDFGDGNTSDEANPVHTYTQPGAYNVQLTVTDYWNVQDTDTITIKTASPSVPEAEVTTSDGRFGVGEKLAFSGSATDLNDGNIPADKLHWQLIRHYDGTTEVLHTSAGVANGTFPALPDVDYDRIEVQLTAVNSAGKSARISVFLEPREVALRLESSPAGMPLRFDDIEQQAPLTITALAGSSHTIEALNHEGWTFVGWSDAGTQAHTITVPNEDTTLTATYKARTPNHSVWLPLIIR
ncbi:MAG: PKD domain-containing protein [Chloroflexota bacterium]